MKALYLSHDQSLPPRGEYHYIDVGDKRLFILTDEAQRNVPETFEPLPFLIDPSPVSAAHAAHLAPLGAKPNHSALDVLKLAHSIHPQFKP